MCRGRISIGSGRVGRRLSLLLAALLVVQPLIYLTGCGGGNTALPPAGSGLTQATGTVNKAEVGGQDLQVTTAYQEVAPVDSAGGFTTQVSTEGAQLIFARDGAKAIHALAISIPAVPSSGRQAAPLQIDAQATAAAMIFMTPGILSIDPDEATTRLAQIKALADFPSLLAAVRAKMPTEDYHQLAQDADVTGPLETCVNEWLTANPTRIALVTSPKGATSVTVTNESNPGSTGVQIENFGWRYVQVIRRDIRAGQEQRVTNLGTMPGLIGFSLGSLFTHSVLDSSYKTDAVNFSPSTGANSSEFWIFGPGWSSDADAPPGSVSQGFGAWGKSMLTYVVLPSISLLLGANVTSAKVDQLWSTIEGSINFSAMTHDTDWRSICRDALDTLAAMADVLISTGALKAVGIVLPGPLTLFIAGLFADMAVANMIGAVGTWIDLPASARITVTVTGDTGVIVN